MTVYYTHFEMTSIMFLLLLMFFFFSNNRVDTPSMHVFAAYLMLSFAVMMMDLLSVAFLSSELVNTLFLAIQVFLSPMFLLYMLSLVNLVSRKNALWLALAALPAVAMFLLVITNHFTDLIFYYDSVGRYTHGPVHSIMYAVAGLYLFATLACTLVFQKRLEKSKVIAVYLISIVATGLMIAQLILKEYLLSGTGVVLGQYMMYHTFQNPKEYIDAPTGALNRRALVLRVERERAVRQPLSLGVISLRAFKSVNDVLGISSGDMLLRAVAEYLISVVGTANAYRFVGDVFVVAIRDTDSSQQLLARIRKRFCDPWEAGKVSMRLTASVGLIGAEHCRSNTDELIKLIEFTVKEMKLRRSESLICVDERVSDSMRRCAAIEQALMQAIQDNCVEMHYQPLLDVTTRGFPTFEALARLELKDVGYIPPDEFISLAERNGLIIQLGETILESVCRFLSSQQPQRYGLELAQINLSVVQCMDAGFAARCLDILKRYGVDPAMICLEITETAASYSDQTLLDNMSALCAAGVSFALDDYGSGYSTADYVMRMPFSHVKLDKKLVNDAGRSERSRLLVCSLTQMFGRLGFKVVAEGVETEEEAAHLTEFGADYLQGYLYSKPLPAEKYMDFLRSSRPEVGNA